MSGQELEVTVEVKKFSTLATFPKVRFTATMFRALEHTVLWSTQCFVVQNSRLNTTNMNSHRQKLGLVEAQNSVPPIWTPGTEGASGATGYYVGSLRSSRGRFLLWERESEMRKGGDEARLTKK